MTTTMTLGTLKTIKRIVTAITIVVMGARATIVVHLLIGIAIILNVRVAGRDMVHVTSRVAMAQKVAAAATTVLRAVARGMVRPVAATVVTITRGATAAITATIMTATYGIAQRMRSPHGSAMMMLNAGAGRTASVTAATTVGSASDI